MKKIVLFLLLSLTIGGASAQKSDSLLQDAMEARAFADHWDTIPGTENDKILAMTKAGVPIQINDSVKNESYRWLGFLFTKESTYQRFITYDPTDKRFSVQEHFTSMVLDLPLLIFSLVALLSGIFFLFLLGSGLFEDSKNFFSWLIWICTAGGIIYISPSISGRLLHYSVWS